MTRAATLADLPRLLEIEAQAFPFDRISRRSFRHLLTRANAVSLVEEAPVDVDAAGLCGYVTLLFNRRSSLARLYSIAVHPRCRGRGVGERLLSAAEAACRARGCTALRLEVHPHNAGARRLYARAGYRAFGQYRRFYEDGADATRMEKSLLPARQAESAPPARD